MLKIDFIYLFRTFQLRHPIIRRKLRINNYEFTEQMEEVPYEFIAIVHTLLTKHSEINMSHKDGRVTIEFK